jgi:YidC/Oxa1 family membrane protein insertase
MSNKKKYDKTTVAVVAVCIVLLFGWNYIFGPSGLNWLPQPQPKEQIEQVVGTENTVSERTDTTVAQEAKPATKKSKTEAVSNSSVATLQDKTEAGKSLEEWTAKYPAVKFTSPDSLYDMTINPASGDIEQVTLNKIYNANDKNPVILAKGIVPGALTVAPPSDNDSWKLIDVKPLVKTKDSLTVTRDFENQNGQDFSLTQKWKLGKDYSTKFDVTLHNNSSNTLNLRDLYFYVGSIPTVKFISGDNARMESHSVDALLASSDKLYTLKAGSSDFQKNPIQYEPIKWLSVSDGYYAYILKTAGNTQIKSGNFSYTSKGSVKTEKGEENFDLIGSAARVQSINLDPNAQQSWSFDYYTGPKDIEILDGFAPKAGEILHLMSWPVFKTLAEWFLYALIWLKGVCGNFGLAIILLTIIVKLIFWPITHKSNKSMKRMQHIQPKVKALREMYKDDKQKLNQATMELYKTEKVNPLGGCLPILIQIPVFIALYYTLMGAFEIRHSSFLWAADLAQPDTVGHIFGVAINPFAIMMAITMLLQQKMMPTATDPAQAKMMMIMPIVMLFFLYNLPSGLTLYWTVSQLFTIFQLLYNKYTDKEDGGSKDFTKNDNSKNYKINKANKKNKKANA